MAQSPDSAAVIAREPGGPDVLRVVHLPQPEPASGEVRVRVTAAAVHPADVAFRLGAHGMNGSGPHIPGMTIAGVIDVSEPDSAWRVGDRVMGMTLPSSRYGGGYRASVVAPSDTLVGVPADVDLYTAASLPMNGHTALQALRLAAVGETPVTIAITGAAGSLGAVVLALAVARGARVVAVARPDDRNALLEHGATAFVAAGQHLATRICEAAGGPVDALIDLAVLDDQVVGAVREGGVLVTLRGWRGNGDEPIRIAPVSVPAEWHRADHLDAVLRGRHLHRPIRRFTPADAPAAHRLLSRGGLRENLVLDFA